MNDPTHARAFAPQDVDLAAERLLDTVDSACEAAPGFPAQVEASLDSAFALLAAEPDLAHYLVARSADNAINDAQRAFGAACAARLRAAGERAGTPSDRPSFTERFLVAALQFEVSRCLDYEELDRLRERVADLRAFILAYYSEPRRSEPR
jgi:hypothetical protein